MKNYFGKNEFKCKCGCGMDIEPELKEMMNMAREKAGVPFIVNSGARCLKHNRNIGSGDTSSHVKGLAVDIRAVSSSERFAVMKGFYEAGFKRIGINTAKGFIHVDIDEDKPQNLMFKY